MLAYFRDNTIFAMHSAISVAHADILDSAFRFSERVNLDTSQSRHSLLLLHQKVENALLVCIRANCEIQPSGVFFPNLCSKGVQAQHGGLGKW